MSTSLVFTVPSVEMCERVVDTLRNVEVSEESISVIANSDIDLGELPDGGTLENDALPAVQRGVTIGGAVGLLAGLSALTIAPGLMVAGAAMGLAAAGGASLGALGSVLVGSSVPNTRLRDYEDAIARGDLLLVVELEDKAERSVRAALLGDFPELEFAGELDASPPVI